MADRVPTDQHARRRDRWLGLGRLSTALILAGMALLMASTFRWAGGLYLAAAGLAGSALFGAFRSGGRTQRSVLLLLDVGWVTLAVLSAGRADAGLTVLYPLVAFAAGLALGGPVALVLSLAAGIALVGTVSALEGLLTGPAGVVVQGFLVIVLGAVSSRMRSQIVSRERELVYASRALERMRIDTDTIVQNLDSGLISADASGRVVHLNRAGEATLGLEADRVRGLHIRDALSNCAPDLSDLLESSLRNGRAASRVEIPLRRFGETIPLGVGVTVLRGSEEEAWGVAALFQDLTEVRREEERARRRERLAAIGELAAGIAHEIRNSILPVSGSVQLLSQELGLNDEQKRLFEVIEKETDNVERFVGALLAYSRSQAMHPEALELPSFAGEMARDLELSRSRAPRILLQGEEAAAWADREQLRQVVRNLVANAADAAGEDGTIVLRTGVDEEGRPWLEVEDDGPGIPETERARVFEPFYTTKAGGTGLGLPIASRIVEEHGGSLSLERAPGGGAVFRIVLAGAPARTPVPALAA